MICFDACAQLVNVQSNSEFASHQLNRDTWRDETLVSIVEGSFVFLQVPVLAPVPVEKLSLYLPSKHGPWLSVPKVTSSHL